MKFWTRLVLAAVVVYLSSYAASYGADGEIRNLALNRPCEFYPDRLRGTREPSHDYAGDALRLSNGYTDYQSRTMFTDITALDWQHGIDAPLVILFDLGGEATVSEVRVYTSGGGHAGITEPGLRVLTSLDNKAFFFASKSPAPLPPETREHRPVIKVAKLDNCRARYVAISLLPRRSPITNYRMVTDEIEIMGMMPADETSMLPIGRSIKASGAEEVQGVLAEGIRAKNRFKNLSASLKTHRTMWPKPLAEAQEKEIAAFRKRIDSDGGSYRNVFEELTEHQRLSA